MANPFLWRSEKVLEVSNNEQQANTYFVNKNSLILTIYQHMYVEFWLKFTCD